MFIVATAVFQLIGVVAANTAVAGDVANSNDGAFLAHVFGDAQSVATRKQEITEMNRNFETRQQYGLATRYDRQEQHDRMAAYGEKMGLQALDAQARTSSARMKEISKESQAARIILTPAILVTGAYMIYRGQPLKGRLSQNTQIVAQSKFADRKGSLAIQHRDADAAIEMDRSAGTQEALTTRVSGQIPGLDLNSRVAYGLDSHMVHTSVSRVLIAQVSGTYEHSRSASGAAGGQDRLSLNWGLNF